MKERTIELQPLNISDVVFFLGTEEEQEEAERIETARREEIRQIINAPGFVALEYYSYYKQRRILHKSPRQGIKYQLSYIDPDGIPAMHENYIKDGESPETSHIGTEAELIRHFENASRNGLKLTILED